MQQQTVNAKVREAHKHLSGGRLAECYRLSHEVLAVQPGHADAIFMLGLVAFFTGNDVEMKECLEYLTTRKASHGHHHRFLGEYYTLCDLLEEAAKQFDRALTLSPELVDVHRQLGQVLRGLGDLDGATRHLQVFLRSKNDDSTALTEMGWVSLDKGKADEALELFNKVLAIDDSQAEAVCGAGCAMSELGQTERALPLLRRAMELSPDDPIPCINLGDLLYQDGKLEESIFLY